MNINDLPDELKALALLRHEEKPMDKGAEDLQDMFEWCGTPEDSSFWLRIYEQKYTMDDIEYARGIVNIDCSPLLFN
jgi:hypothetical protein